MIIEIEKPKSCKNLIHDTFCKFYFDLSSKEYFFLTSYSERIYFNLNGEWHNSSGPAILQNVKYEETCYWLYNKPYTTKQFANKTNHLICMSCKDFCGQECFMEENND